MPYWLLVTIFTILLLPGFAGVFLPLPSLPYMFGITLIFGFIDQWQHLNYVELTILSFVMLVSFAAEYLTGLIGAKYGGATKISIVFGLVGMLIGLIVFPPFGGVAGLFLGILVSEFVTFRDHIKALKAASGGLIGTLVGMLVSLILAILYIVLFIVFVT
jgi:hypothetical protein